MPNLSSGNVGHVGARNSLNPKDWIDLARERNVRFHPMFEVLERGVDTVVDEAAARVWNGTDAQYLSFNLNVMDASVAPGVTATEPGGLESREMMRIADALGRRGGPSVIEISELCPIFDVSGTTSRLAVCVRAPAHGGNGKGTWRGGGSDHQAFPAGLSMVRKKVVARHAAIT